MYVIKGFNHFKILAMRISHRLIEAPLSTKIESNKFTNLLKLQLTTKSAYKIKTQTTKTQTD